MVFENGEEKLKDFSLIFLREISSYITMTYSDNYNSD